MASPRHCATWWLPDVKLSHFAGKIKPPPNHIKGLGMIRAGITVPIENKGNTTEVNGEGHGKPFQHSRGIPWTEEPGRLWFVGSQRIGHDEVT